MDTQEKKMIRIPRLPKSEFFMLQAHLTATRATCDRGPELLLCPGRHGVGAVLVRGDRAIASGFNGSPPGEPHCDEFVCDSCGSRWDEEPTPAKRYVHNDGSPTCNRLLRERDIYRPSEYCSGRMVGGHLIVENHCVRTLHAEENALLQCALDGVSPAGATVFTTASPCYDCAKRFVRVGITRVVHGATYGSRYGLSEEAVGLLKRAGIAVEHLDVSGLLEVK
jgi:dCMP deaminase